jgi:hypothetical protein
VQEFVDKDKSKSELIIFDDFNNLSKKKMKKIFDYAISSRKFGFTCVFMAQFYMAVPKIISRNCNYIFTFRTNDKYSIKRVISNHGLSSHVSPETIKQFYYYAIEEPLSFLLIDSKTNDDKLKISKRFTEFLY